MFGIGVLLLFVSAAPSEPTLRFDTFKLKLNREQEAGFAHPALPDARGRISLSRPPGDCNSFCTHLLPSHYPRRKIWQVNLSLLLPNDFCSSKHPRVLMKCLLPPPLRHKPLPHSEALTCVLRTLSKNSSRQFPWDWNGISGERGHVGMWVMLSLC